MGVNEVSDNKDHVLIFTGGETAVSALDARRGLGNAMKTTTTKAFEVAVSTLQENMRRFLESLDTPSSVHHQRMSAGLCSTKWRFVPRLTAKETSEFTASQARKFLRKAASSLYCERRCSP